MRDMLRWSLHAVLALLMSTLVPAEAALHVCNKTARPVKTAVGRFDGAQWASEGWWTIAARTCASLVPGSLNARYYYLFATDGSSGSWDGGHNFCVAQTEKFEIKNRGNCARRGFEQKGFFEIDTGSQADYTQSLAD